MSTVHRAAFIAALLIAVIGAPVRAATNHATVVAQTASATGTVSGTIVDSNGRLVPGAGVTANGGGRSQKAVSNGSGTFALALPPGIYTITVSKGGYQTAQQDVVVGGGESIKANITLTVASLSNLNVIGRTSTTSTRNAATFNVSSNAAPSVGVQTIRERNTPDLSQIVQTIPGVTITDSATNVNHQFVVHGLSNETRLTIDGHPVSTGISGQFITNYAGSGLFSAVDTYQGAVVGPPSAGTSGAGIINLRTPDFSAKNGGYVLTGLDQYGGSQYTIIANANALDNRLQVVLGKSFSGYNGPSKGVIADDINTAESYNFPTNPATLQAPKLGYYPITGNYTVPTLGQGLAPAYTIASATDFSNTYSLNAQVTKVRWNFSPATSLGAEFLGLQGRYDPQGNAYGQIAGYEAIPQCVNATTLPSKINVRRAGQRREVHRDLDLQRTVDGKPDRDAAAAVSVLSGLRRAPERAQLQSRFQDHAGRRHDLVPSVYRQHRPLHRRQPRGGGAGQRRRLVRSHQHRQLSGQLHQAVGGKRRRNRSVFLGKRGQWFDRLRHRETTPNSERSFRIKRRCCPMAAWAARPALPVLTRRRPPRPKAATPATAPPTARSSSTNSTATRSPTSIRFRKIT